MLKRFLCMGLCTVMVFLSCIFANPSNVEAVSAYTFDGPMSQAVMESYLDRAVTLMDMTESFTTDAKRNEMTRFSVNVGAKLLGRAAGVWAGFSDDEAKFTKAASFAAYVHSQDPEIILQAAIYETTDLTVNNIPIPSWVFQAFNQQVVTRNFNYNNMLFSDGRMVNLWAQGCSVPDITKLETQMWVYYRARRYIDCGFEAFHLGQTALTGSVDTNYAVWSSVMSKIRSYASTNARRHNILLDSHNPNMVYNGNLMLDYVAFPCRPDEVVGNPQDAILRSDNYLDSIIGKTIGGNNPQGWYCARSPYLLELDNWSGISGTPGVASSNDIGVWGYDEIAWFAHQNSTYRQNWLNYAYKYLKAVDPIGHFEMPGIRTLGTAVSYIFTSGFESGDPAPTYTTLYSANVSGAGLWIDSSNKSTGVNSIKYSGTDNSISASYNYWQIYDVNIPVTPGTSLSYDILPLNENGRHAGVDLICTDGTTLRDTQAADMFGVRMHPAFARGVINTWSGTGCTIGNWLAGKTIDKIVVAYDNAPSTGAFSGYIDNIIITDYSYNGFYNAANTSSVYPNSYGDETAIKNIWAGTVAAPSVTNPDFENGTSPWSLGTHWSVSSADKHSGTYSVKCAGTSDNCNLYQRVNVSPYTNYTFSFYGKCNKASTFKVLSGDWSTNLSGDQLTTNNNTWTKYSVSFNSGNRTNVIIYVCDNGGGSYTSYYDDFDLR